MTTKLSIYMPDDLYQVIRRRFARAIERGEQIKQNDIIVDLIRHGLDAVRKDPEWRDVIAPPRDR